MELDRFDGPANLMIVSDLDFTLVDHDDPKDTSLLRFNALWEAHYRHDSILVYSTGRSPAIYRQLRKEKPMLSPDITILSVGTEIMYGDSMLPDDDWLQYLNEKWDRDIVVEETSRFPQLTPQSETEQRPHKVSFFVDKGDALGAIEILYELLQKRGLDVKIIYSSGTALDVLPRGAGKGQALAYLLEKFEAKKSLPLKTLVCGDSGNDAELFTVPCIYGVMVRNAQEELLQWYEVNAKNNSNIIHSSERCASGIIQAIGTFCLGPSISPRDISDFQELKAERSNPGHEVVKFYLFYERWQKAEVEKSSLDNLRSDFYSPGICVHPSGMDRPFYRCIDGMNELYGSKQGEHFQIWVDRVSASQIGSDLWLVKFEKWESSGLLDDSITQFKASDVSWSVSVGSYASNMD